MKKEYFLILFSFVFAVWISSCSNPEREKFEAYIKEGESLAKTHCTTCHKEAPPELLNKKTWVFDVLPQMGPRLGMHRYNELHYKEIFPMLVAPTPAMKQEEWNSLVDYFHYSSLEPLQEQDYDQEPALDCATFSARTFTNEISSNSIVTMLKIDTVKQYVFASEASNSTLYKFDYSGKLIDTVHLPSPQTDMRIEEDFFEVTLAGILHPNNENKGQVIRYTYGEEFPAEIDRIILDSLYRPVASVCFDFNYDGKDDYLVCEYGNDIGQFALYFASSETAYIQNIIDTIPGSIMIKLHDFNADGFMDIVALFAQGDERIMIYYNDGEGNFKKNFSIAARFPPVYGSLYIDIQDFNGDGYMDIIYVNGDNFDYSQILKPYHGIRIFENDGYNFFEEKYFYPIYGAGKVKVYDFDLDEDLDIMVSSNFADMEKHPERGIIYLENTGSYDFTPYAFPASALNQWNTMGVTDLDGDGDQDIIIGAMNLENAFNMAYIESEGGSKKDISSLLVMENLTY